MASLRKYVVCFFASVNIFVAVKFGNCSVCDSGSGCAACNPDCADINLPNGNESCDDTAHSNVLEVCTFTCNPGYILNGWEILTLYADDPNYGQGGWVATGYGGVGDLGGNVPPFCMPYNCTTPNFAQNGIPNGNAACTGKSMGSTCTLTCNAGYQLIGESQITCDLSNPDQYGHPQWNSSPYCEKYDPTTIEYPGDAETITVPIEHNAAVNRKGYSHVLYLFALLLFLTELLNNFFLTP